jgi:ribosomal protein S18 acetylase RimI-like enzyme
MLSLEIITKLQTSELTEAARVIQRGLQRQIPGERGKLSKIIENLRKQNCFVYKEKGEIKGIVWFRINKNNIQIKFICADKPRKGIGSRLILNLAQYGLAKKIRYVISIVSLADIKAVKFYNSLGFKQYKKFKSNGSYIRVRPIDIIKKKQNLI